MKVLEHVPASRVRQDGYRDPHARDDGVLVAVAGRADASRWAPWLFGIASAGCAACAAFLVAVSFTPVDTIVLVGASVILGLRTVHAGARALTRLRLELRGAKVTARTVGIPRHTVALDAAEVRSFDVLDLDSGHSAAPEVALVARLAGDRVVALLTPLSREDGSALRELASSALGVSVRDDAQ